MTISDEKTLPFKRGDLVTDHTGGIGVVTGFENNWGVKVGEDPIILVLVRLQGTMFYPNRKVPITRLRKL